MHVLEQFVLHFLSATCLTVAVFFGLFYWGRHNKKVSIWVSGNWIHLLVTSALIIAAILPLREPYDIWRGNNTFTKSCFDQVSWFAGVAVAAWGLYRFRRDPQ